MIKKRLPKVNPHGELEEISKRRIRSLFEIEKFEIKKEEEKDTGIDWIVELKDEGYYTNYRFNLQLKSKAKYKVNRDGSVSKSIETSNINYLLNGAIPAFYTFYVKENDKIYYEYLNNFVKNLEIKNVKWGMQKSHVCRFTKCLDRNTLDEIYYLVYQRGEELRENNQNLVKINASLNDLSIEINSYKDINQLIEKEGFHFLKKADSKKIIALHESSSNTKGNSRYNFLVGLAYENVGEFMKALDFFNTAALQKENLGLDLFDYLKYQKSLVEYTLGFIDVNEYNNNLKLLSDSTIIGLYLKISKAKSNYILTMDYNKFIVEFDAINNHPNSNDIIKFYCRIEKLSIEGARLNAAYAQEIASINHNWGDNNLLALHEFEKYMAHNIGTWDLEFKNLLNLIAKSGDKIIFYQCRLVGYSVIYEFNVFVKYFNFQNKGVQSFDDLNLLVDEFLNEIIEYFESIDYFEDLFTALEVKFRILHFIERYEEAENIANKLKTIAIKAYSKKRKEICENLVERTPHYNIKIQKEKIFQERKEWEIIVKQMQEMDEIEPLNIEIENSFEINLFPIGSFKIDKSKVETVFKILNIHNPLVKDTFTLMFNKGIVPIANIFYDKVNVEGYREGKFADKGIDNWKNIFRVRKAFFENKFYRIRSHQNS